MFKMGCSMARKILAPGSGGAGGSSSSASNLSATSGPNLGPNDSGKHSKKQQPGGGNSGPPNAAASSKSADELNDFSKLEEDPRLPLNVRQIFKITKSWKAIARTMSKTGTAMFLNLFEQNQDLFYLFDRFQHLKGKELHESMELREHAATVMATLDQSINSLSNYDNFVTYLHSIGKLHRKVPGFKREHFWKIEQPFLKAVKQTLDERCNETIEEIYKIAIKLIIETIAVGYGLDDDQQEGDVAGGGGDGSDGGAAGQGGQSGNGAGTNGAQRNTSSGRTVADSGAGTSSKSGGANKSGQTRDSAASAKTKCQQLACPVEAIRKLFDGQSRCVTRCPADKPTKRYEELCAGGYKREAEGEDGEEEEEEEEEVVEREVSSNCSMESSVDGGGVTANAICELIRTTTQLVEQQTSRRADEMSLETTLFLLRGLQSAGSNRVGAGALGEVPKGAERRRQQQQEMEFEERQQRMASFDVDKEYQRVASKTPSCQATTTAMSAMEASERCNNDNNNTGRHWSYDDEELKNEGKEEAGASVGNLVLAKEQTTLNRLFNVPNLSRSGRPSNGAALAMRVGQDETAIRRQCASPKKRPAGRVIKKAQSAHWSKQRPQRTNAKTTRGEKTTTVSKSFAGQQQRREREEESAQVPIVCPNNRPLSATCYLHCRPANKTFNDDNSFIDEAENKRLRESEELLVDLELRNEVILGDESSKKKEKFMTRSDKTTEWGVPDELVGELVGANKSVCATGNDGQVVEAPLEQKKKPSQQPANHCSLRAKLSTSLSSSLVVGEAPKQRQSKINGWGLVPDSSNNLTTSGAEPPNGELVVIGDFIRASEEKFNEETRVAAAAVVPPPPPPTTTTTTTVTRLANYTEDDDCAGSPRDAANKFRPCSSTNSSGSNSPRQLRLTSSEIRTTTEIAANLLDPFESAKMVLETRFDNRDSPPGPDQLADRRQNRDQSTSKSTRQLESNQGRLLSLLGPQCELTNNKQAPSPTNRDKPNKLQSSKTACDQLLPQQEQECHNSNNNTPIKVLHSNGSNKNDHNRRPYTNGKQSETNITDEVKSKPNSTKGSKGERFESVGAHLGPNSNELASSIDELVANGQDLDQLTGMLMLISKLILTLASSGGQVTGGVNGCDHSMMVTSSAQIN